jgi:SPP1 family predicted phage head-tail adaptor
MGIAAGKMRHWVILMMPPAPGVNDDSFGQQSMVPVSLGGFWASVEPMDGREMVIGKAVRGDTTHMVTMRFNPNVPVTDKHWLTYKGRVLNITKVLDIDELEVELTLLCTEPTTPP